MPKKNKHVDDPRSKATQNIEELSQHEVESLSQQLPEQKTIFKTDSIKSRAGRRGVHNLPDQRNAPLGFDPDKAYDGVFPFIKLPYLQPNTKDDIITFGLENTAAYLDERAKKISLNALLFGDNLHILRAFPSNSIDLIYIDPPFFSGREYNQIWGDENEVRTFNDIWEDGLPSYLIWLNARLWEMRRVLKNTGSIYVHCDWHASHHIKCEMDKIFGYKNFKANIIWSYDWGGRGETQWPQKHDDILFYSKTNKWFFDPSKVRVSYKTQVKGRKKPLVSKEKFDRGKLPTDVWDMSVIHAMSPERIGYPTQKPEALLERIIKSSCPEKGIVADFFMGGGTTCAVAQKLNRRFIGSDISRVACSVALNRIVKDAEEISGVTASTNKKKSRKKQESLDFPTKKVPNLYVYYMGVYPIEKFKNINQGHFEEFILTSYNSRRFTGEGKITGVMNAATSILIGPSKSEKSVSERELKQFVTDCLKLRYQKNIRVKLKIIAWIFPPSIQKYAKILENYFFKQNLPIEIELVPVNSQLFRKRILEHYQDSAKTEFLLKFISQASIMDLTYRKKNGLKYEFKAVGARSNNLDGKLINCQWDFDYQGDRFAEEKYALMREKKDSKYKAVLVAEKEFAKPGKYIVACRIQDNLGGEATRTKEVDIK